MIKPVVGLICNKRTLNSDIMGSMDLSYVTEDYINSLERVNCIPVQIPTLKNAEDYDKIIDKFDGLLFTGGADVAPSIYGQDAKFGLEEVFEETDIAQVYLAKLAQKKNIPVLGICKGCQIINVAFGGTLFQDIEREIKGANLHFQKSKRHRATHQVNIKEGSLLHEVLGNKIHTNSYHHQSVDIVGEGLKVIATANDGVVECLENPDNDFFLACQWHPEMMMTRNDIMLPIFEKFADAMINYIDGKTKD